MEIRQREKIAAEDRNPAALTQAQLPPKTG